MTLTDRSVKEGVRDGVWFEATTKNDLKFSVVNLGKLMETSPGYEHLKASGLFLGWEAILLKEDGELDTDKLYRGATLDELTSKIDNLL